MRRAEPATRRRGDAGSAHSSATPDGPWTCSTTSPSVAVRPCAPSSSRPAAPSSTLEEICRVEGIDCMTIAPLDLSTQLGVSGQLDAPERVEAITYAEKVIRHAGIPWVAGH